MNAEFNEWWNNDLLTEDNPFVDGTPAFWAWEGWCAAVKAEREACAKVASGFYVSDASNYPSHIAAAIRARGQA